MGQDKLQTVMQLPRNEIRTDDNFLSLLSSQRELLSQLNHKDHGRRIGARTNTRPSRHDLVALSQKIPISRHMTDRRSSLDMLLPKRFSLSHGPDSTHLPTLSIDIDRLDLDFSCHTLSKESLHAIRSEKYDDFFSEARRKKRRLSSLGFISPSFFEDNMKLSRNSVRSISKPLGGKENDDDEDDEDIDDVESIIGEKDDDFIPMEPLGQENKRLDPAHVKSVMESFTEAMEKSQKSQQSIHDWDRKMGLKRSHSKTMRLSSRSRKKLKTVLKKEITALSAKL